jgi:hypothetical protein
MIFFILPVLNVSLVKKQKQTNKKQKQTNKKQEKQNKANTKNTSLPSTLIIK